MFVTDSGQKVDSAKCTYWAGLVISEFADSLFEEKAVSLLSFSPHTQPYTHLTENITITIVITITCYHLSANIFEQKYRSTRKTFADLKFLCNFIEGEAKLNGMDPSNRSVANVGLLYERVEKSLFKGERGRW